MVKKTIIVCIQPLVFRGVFRRCSMCFQGLHFENMEEHHQVWSNILKFLKHCLWTNGLLATLRGQAWKRYPFFCLIPIIQPWSGKSPHESEASSMQLAEQSEVGCLIRSDMQDECCHVGQVLKSWKILKSFVNGKGYCTSILDTKSEKLPKKLQSFVITMKNPMGSVSVSFWSVGCYKNMSCI